MTASESFAGARFEDALKIAYAGELWKYCLGMKVDPRVDPSREPVRVTIVTGSPLGEPTRQWIRGHTTESVRRDLRTTASLAFPTRAGLRPPGYLIEIEPPLLDNTTDPGSQSHPPIRPVPGRRTDGEALGRRSDRPGHCPVRQGIG